MKLVIDGREFDPAAQPFIGDLRLLKPEFGFGWGTVARRLQGLNTDADFLDLLDDDEFTEALMAWMWMARLRAGERDLTLDEVRMTAIDQITWKAEPGDELPEDGSVPTSAPMVGSRGELEPSPDTASTASPSSSRGGHQPKRASTKTSKKPSTAA